MEQRMVAVVVDAKGDTIEIGDLVGYAVVDNGERRETIIQMGIVIGSHYGGRGGEYPMLNLRRIDGKNIGQIKPEKVEGIWTLKRMITLTGPEVKRIERDMERRRCAEIVSQYISLREVQRDDQWVNDMLLEMRKEIIGYKRGEHNENAPLNEDQIMKESWQRILAGGEEGKKEKKRRKRKKPQNRRRTECPKCGWMMEPDERDDSLYRCIRCGCIETEEEWYEKGERVMR